jgi:four helix bundle protein
MNPEEFKKRTKAFGLRVIRLYESLPEKGAAQVLGRQLLRSGTSVGANYRAACRAKSRADFISKMGNVEEECDESVYWMEMLIESGVVRQSRLSVLVKEGEELLALVVSSINTARSRQKSAIRNPQSAIK